jgi:hypothetical protein
MGGHSNNAHVWYSGGRVTRYLLECPGCEARFDLKAYAPERRVKCRRCGLVVAIPFAPGDPAAARAEAKGLSPEMQQKVIRVFSLRRLAALAGVLLLAAAGGAVLLVKRYEARQAAPPPAAPEVTVQSLPALLGAYALPLGRGFSWEYALSGGGSEVREVLRESIGPDEAPEYHVGVRGSAQADTLWLRVTRDAVLLLGTSRGELPAPVVVVPHPLYTDGAWSQDGPGGKVDFRGLGVEKLQVPAGTFDHCVRVEARGTRSGAAVEETLWYARGVGLVRRASKVDGRLEIAELRKYVLKR